jgi:hypothetical protein
MIRASSITAAEEFMFVNGGIRLKYFLPTWDRDLRVTRLNESTTTATTSRAIASGFQRPSKQRTEASSTRTVDDAEVHGRLLVYEFTDSEHGHQRDDRNEHTEQRQPAIAAHSDEL